jgi:hypothetical protein
MKDTRIISVVGKPGLYKLLTSTKGGVIAESLIDKKRTMVPFTSISALDEIAIYTYDKEIPLWKVFASIAEKYNFEKTISHKSSSAELNKFFREILPDFDEDRVYPSHIKKVAQWYNILVDTGLLKDYLEYKKEEEKKFEETEAKENQE